MHLENCISNLYKQLPIGELFSFVPESPSFLTKKVGKSVLFAAGSCLSRFLSGTDVGSVGFPCCCKQRAAIRSPHGPHIGSREGARSLQKTSARKTSPATFLR